MRKLKLQMQVSLDGFVAGLDNRMDWMTWDWDEGLKQYVSELTSSIDLILLGRALAEGFIPTWESRLADPATADEAARIFVNTPKVVFTKSMQENSWANASLEAGDIVTAVQELKAQQGKDIITYGGVGLASSLIAHNLIDEYHLFINPTAIGKGVGIFSSISKDLRSQLISAHGFECGVTVLVYRPS
jgi:dihydrofolate reductase